MWHNDLKARDYSVDGLITGTLGLEVEVKQGHPFNPILNIAQG